MPDGYMLNVWVLISNLLDRMLQSVREPFLVGIEIGPSPIKLVFVIIILLYLVTV